MLAMKAVAEGFPRSRRFNKVRLSIDANTTQVKKLRQFLASAMILHVVTPCYLEAVTAV